MAVKKYVADKFVGLSMDEKPLTVADGATFYESDTLSIFLKVDGAWTPVGGGSGFGLIIPHSYTGITQGTWIGTGDGLWGARINTSNADGDQIDYGESVFLNAGTYTFHVLGSKNTNRGILDFLVNGESVGTVDQYGAYAEDHNFRATGCVIATSGLKNISIKVTGKNGSSTGYYISFSYISFWKTG